MSDPDIRRVAGQLRQARRLLFITGAGISADSGLPTYRGIGGLYNDTDTDDELPIEVALSGDILRQRPELTWKYLLQVESACRGAAPNAAHRIIAALQESHEVWVLTQNIDGFHGDAGSRNLIEMHGNVRYLHCMTCSWEDEVPDYAALAPLPRCPDCDAVIRPRVVLFGEMLPEPAVDTLMRELQTGFDMVFSIGTTSVFPYIAAPGIEAARAGLPTVEINPGDSEVSGIVQTRLRLGAAAALQALQEALSDE